MDASGNLLVVAHTFEETGSARCKLRVNLGAKGDQEGSEAVRDRGMKKEYDFSKGVRGKFYRPDAELRIPVYLEPESVTFLCKIAEEKGTDVQQIVNDLIRRDIDRIKSVG